MIITKEFLELTFNELNSKLFAGRLPAVPLGLCRTRTAMAKCQYTSVKQPDGRVVHSRISVMASLLFDLPAEEWRNVIAHEMIHLFNVVHNFLDSGAHGPLFVALMNEINATHGMHITVKGAVEPAARVADTRQRARVVARISLAGGSVALKVLPRVDETIRKYQAAVRRAAGVKSVEFFVSVNPFFARYPSSGALRYHPVDAAVLASALADATPLKSL